MKKSQYEAAVERLKAVNAVIGELDPAIRADAFKLLESYVTGEQAIGAGTANHAGASDTRVRNVGDEPVPEATASALDDDVITELVEKHESTTASDNGVLVTAIFYAV